MVIKNDRKFAVYFTKRFYGQNMIHIWASSSYDAIECAKNDGVGFSNGPVIPDQVHFAIDITPAQGGHARTILTAAEQTAIDLLEIADKTNRIDQAIFARALARDIIRREEVEKIERDSFNKNKGRINAMEDEY